MVRKSTLCKVRINTSGVQDSSLSNGDNRVSLKILNLLFYFLLIVFSVHEFLYCTFIFSYFHIFMFLYFYLPFY